MRTGYAPLRVLRNQSRRSPRIVGFRFDRQLNALTAYKDVEIQQGVNHGYFR